MANTLSGLAGGVRLSRAGLWRGEEKISRGGEELAPEVAKDFEVVTAGNVLGAEGEAKSEIKTYAEIQHKGGGNAEAGPDERAAAKDFRTAGGNTERHSSRRERDVADVKRHTEEVADDRSHAEHETENYGAAPTGDVPGKRFGKTQQSFGLE